MQATASLINTIALADIGTAEQSPIYPVHPIAKELSDQQGHSYRLQQISLLKLQLENEREKRAALYKNIIVI